MKETKELKVRNYVQEGQRYGGGKGEDMTIHELFRLLPLSEKTLLKRITAKSLPTVLANDGGHPCEYYIKNKNGEDCGMVKYYKGRLLTVYGLKGISPVI